MTDRPEPTHGQSEPSPWILRFSEQIPAGEEVIDIACGKGRHGRLFLEKGHPVVFVDIDTDGLDDLGGRSDVSVIETDLETDGFWPFAGHAYAGVIVTNYLWRPILPKIIDLVAPGGLLLYETFAVGNEAFGKPSNPDYLLKPDELRDAVDGKLDVLAFEQLETKTPRPAVIQHIAARNTQAA